MRQLEGARLDALMATLWPLATRRSPDMTAIDRLLRIAERRAKLFGLDMPVKVAPTMPSGEALPQPSDGARYVYFLPEPCASEEEWLARKSTPAEPADSGD